jgi:hypothetical protein
MREQRLNENPIGHVVKSGATVTSAKLPDSWRQERPDSTQERGRIASTSASCRVGAVARKRAGRRDLHSWRRRNSHQTKTRFVIDEWTVELDATTRH